MKLNFSYQEILLHRTNIIFIWRNQISDSNPHASLALPPVAKHIFSECFCPLSGHLQTTRSGQKKRLETMVFRTQNQMARQVSVVAEWKKQHSPLKISLFRLEKGLFPFSIRGAERVHASSSSINF